MKLSVSMIVKNEKEVLERCLKSLKGADEIIICDTGSEDNTVEIAKKYTDKVFTDYKWNDNFAEARNHALSKCTGDWILSIDADEWLNKDGIEKIKKVISKNSSLKAINVLMDFNGTTWFYPRLFKKDKNVYWVNPIHNLLSVIGGVDSGEVIVNVSYSPAHAKDPDRALRILSKEVKRDPKHARNVFYLAREYWYRSKWKETIDYMDKYLKIAKWSSEMADAYYIKAKCYEQLGQFEKAKDNCLQAIKLNGNFKDAWLLLARLSGPGNKIRFNYIASSASNEGVLFAGKGEQIQICMCAYKRIDRLPEIFNQLLSQSVQNFDLSIWNNSGKIIDINKFPYNRIKVFGTGKNEGSKARFNLIQETDAQTIIFIDDDLNLQPDFVEHMIIQHNYYGRNAILGWWSRKFEDNDYWKAKRRLKNGQEADYIGTGGMILNRKIFDENKELYDIPDKYNKVEDLYLCHIARKKEMKLISIDSKCSILDDSKDQWQEIVEYKREAFKSLRKEGFKLINELNKNNANK
jgi:glycosyltransferase involved in cell wall biosynthesis